MSWQMSACTLDDRVGSSSVQDCESWDEKAGRVKTAYKTRTSHTLIWKLRIYFEVVMDSFGEIYFYSVFIVLYDE